MRRVDRRGLLFGLSVSLISVPVVGKEVMKEVSRLKPGEFVWHPEREPEGPVTVIVSIPEQRVHISGFGKLGSHVFVLREVEDQGRHMAWIGIDHGADKHEDSAKLLTRLSADDYFSGQLHARLHAGAMFVVTDLPLHPNSRTGKDFVIMS